MPRINIIEIIKWTGIWINWIKTENYMFSDILITLLHILLLQEKLDCCDTSNFYLSKKTPFLILKFILIAWLKRLMNVISISILI
jgi:hypothetical protein